MKSLSHCLLVAFCLALISIVRSISCIDCRLVYDDENIKF